MVQKYLTEEELNNQEKTQNENIATLDKDIARFQANKKKFEAELAKFEASEQTEDARLLQKLQGVRSAMKDGSADGLFDKVSQLPTEKLEQLRANIKKYKLQIQLEHEDIVAKSTLRSAIQNALEQNRIDNNVLGLYETFRQWVGHVITTGKFFDDVFLPAVRESWDIDLNITSRIDRLKLPTSFKVMLESHITANSIDTISSERLVQQVGELAGAYPPPVFSHKLQSADHDWYGNKPISGKFGSERDLQKGE